MPYRKKDHLSFIKTAPLLLLIISVFACAAKNLGPPVLYPSEKEAQGYSKNDQGWSFENDLVGVAVRQVGPEGEAEDKPTLLDDLYRKGYTLIKLDITNKGEEKVFYNTVLTVFMDDDLGYSKPLDYTDFYDYISITGQKEERLKEIKDRYFDGTVTIAPGDKASRLIVFKPFSLKADSAELKIKDIYSVKGSVNIFFPFTLKRPEKK